MTANLAGLGRDVTGDTVTGRRIDTDHQAPICAWTACGTAAGTESIQISGVPADKATVSWTVAAAPPCVPQTLGEWTSQQNSDGTVTWGWDTDGDGDLNTSNPLELSDYRPPDGDCGGGCNDDGYTDNQCFLTTAVTRLRGEADDGPTLTALRDFRDGPLSETEEGRALIVEYYARAPRIVAAIPDGHPEWAWIAKQVDAARDAILAGRHAKAQAIYVGMVRQLQERWL